MFSYYVYLAVIYKYLGDICLHKHVYICMLKTYERKYDKKIVFEYNKVCE